MAEPIIDPIAFMYAAVESVRKGDVDEISFEFDEQFEFAQGRCLRVTVRKHIQPIIHQIFNGEAHD